GCPQKVADGPHPIILSHLDDFELAYKHRPRRKKRCYIAVLGHWHERREQAGNIGLLNKLYKIALERVRIEHSRLPGPNQRISPLFGHTYRHLAEQIDYFRRYGRSYQSAQRVKRVSVGV